MTKYAIVDGKVVVKDWTDGLRLGMRPAKDADETIKALILMVRDLLQLDVADLKGRLLNVAVGL